MNPWTLGMAALAMAGCVAEEPATLDNPFDPRNAAADDDGDGVTNADEIAAGADPRSQDSDDDGLADADDPCPAQAGTGACSTAGVCAGARTGCPCASEYPDTYDGATELRCDGLDNDCDGDVDEGDPQGGQPCEADGVGACADGIEHCVDGALACVAGDPEVEQCDGLDNDCDGDTDEEEDADLLPCRTGDQGVCESGLQRCVAGEVACVANAEPTPEVCDGLDNDCDGSRDEGDPGGGDACDSGQPGACATGVLRCAQARLKCVTPEPTDETCNAVDDDCDGDVDEDAPELGIECPVFEATGRCADGERACVDGQLRCVGPAPREERCDAVDDDCDGEVDEDDPEGGGRCNTGLDGVCGVGAIRCDAGELSCQAQEEPADQEICDDLDDDCDGEVDEEIAAVERCNGVDDDCDGAVDEDDPDEGQACVADAEGICAAGVSVCRDGALRCDSTVTPLPESCNGLDDDCDGVVDEDDPDLGADCETGLFNQCAEGSIHCVDGEDTCMPLIPQLEEACEGQVDEDCDGATDEGFDLTADPLHCGACGVACAEGQVCVDSQCACEGAGLTACGGACVDTDTDEAHCGGCDVACDEGVECGSGHCGLPELLPGVRTAMPEADLLADGWVRCWQGAYGGAGPSVTRSVLVGCNGPRLALACRPIGHANLTLVAMGERATVLGGAGNGVAWYYDMSIRTQDGRPLGAWGFSPSDAAQPTLNHCDTNRNDQANLRMCWHTSSSSMASGYRCGDNTLNGNNTWERLVYHAPP